MEWRAFYQVSSEDGFLHPKRTQPVENRTDLYVLGTGVDRGVKFRGGNRDIVEIKVRTSVNTNQIEQWTKYKRPVESLGEVMPDLAGVELETIAVQKRRFYEGQLEIVNIIVPSYSRSSVPTYWVSFCLEGWSAPSESELEAVKKRLPQGALIGGYPTWIDALAGGLEPAHQCAQRFHHRINFSMDDVLLERRLDNDITLTELDVSETSSIGVDL